MAYDINALIGSATQRAGAAQANANSIVSQRTPQQQQPSALPQYLTPEDYGKISVINNPAVMGEFFEQSPASTQYKYGEHYIYGDDKSGYWYGQDNTGLPWLGSGKKGDLNDREVRAYKALKDPHSADYFDLVSHPDYKNIRNRWYQSNSFVSESPSYTADGYVWGPTDNFYKYFKRDREALDALDKKYNTGADDYIPVDYYMHAFNKAYPLGPKNKVINPIERARYVGQNWSRQPALASQNLNWDDIAPWANETSAKKAAQYINEELQEDKKRESEDPMGGFGNILGLGLTFLGAPWPVGLANTAGGLIGGSTGGGSNTSITPINGGSNIFGNPKGIFGVGQIEQSQQPQQQPAVNRVMQAVMQNRKNRNAKPVRRPQSQVINQLMQRLGY